MNNITYITYYTENTKYKQILEEHLLPSFKKHDLNHKIYIEKSKDSWIKNVNLKPSIIKKALNELNTDIIFLDTDAIIKEKPELFNEINADIAYHLLDWSTWYNRPEDKTKELLSGTLYLKNNDKVKLMVNEWEQRALGSGKWEQKILNELLPKYHLNEYLLPIEYCYINSMPNGQEPFVKVNKPVIVHYQKSRETKINLK